MSNSFATPWTVAHQTLLSMGFPRTEYWSGLPFPSLGDLPNPRIEPRFPALQADSLPAKPQGKSAFKWETIKNETISHIFETIFHIHHACMCKRHTYAEKGESRREGGIKQIQSLPEIVW